MSCQEGVWPARTSRGVRAPGAEHPPELVDGQGENTFSSRSTLSAAKGQAVGGGHGEGDPGYRLAAFWTELGDIQSQPPPGTAVPPAERPGRRRCRSPRAARVQQRRGGGRGRTAPPDAPERPEGLYQPRSRNARRGHHALVRRGGLECSAPRAGGGHKPSRAGQSGVRRGSGGRRGRLAAPPRTGTEKGKHSRPPPLQKWGCWGYILGDIPVDPLPVRKRMSPRGTCRDSPPAWQWHTSQVGAFSTRPGQGPSRGWTPARGGPLSMKAAFHIPAGRSTPGCWVTSKARMGI